MDETEMTMIRDWHRSEGPGRSLVLSWATLGRLLARPQGATQQPAHVLDHEAAQLSADGGE